MKFILQFFSLFFSFILKLINFQLSFNYPGVSTDWVAGRLQARRGILPRHRRRIRVRARIGSSAGSRRHRLARRRGRGQVPAEVGPFDGQRRPDRVEGEHLLEDAILHELLEPEGVEAGPVDADRVAVVDQGLPVVFHFLQHPVRLQDVDDADEQQEVLPPVVLGGDASPHVVHVPTFDCQLTPAHAQSGNQPRTAHAGAVPADLAPVASSPRVVPFAAGAVPSCQDIIPSIFRDL